MRKNPIIQTIKEGDYCFENSVGTFLTLGVTNLEGQWVKVSNSLCNLLGYTEVELLATNFQSVSGFDSVNHEFSNMYLLIDGHTQNYQMEKMFIHKKGNSIWVLQNTSLIRDSNNKSPYFIHQIQDISDRKKAEQKTLYAALHDALTGLPSRNLLLDRLGLAVERAKRMKNYEFALIFVDLDRFKIVNDSLGHDMGDELLVSLSIRLENCIRSIDTISRLGGDEFAILLDDISEPKHAIDVVERIQTSLQLPFNLNGHNFYSSASIGITYSRKGYDSPEDVLVDADRAMYYAKLNGKGRYEVFTDDMCAQNANALKIENELRAAIGSNELIPFYQPIVSLETGEIVGFEALARWINKTGKFISPSAFIPVAEQSGLILPLGMSMLEKACKDVCNWQNAFLNNQPITISVNVSTKQFTQSDLIKQITDILMKTGLHPKNLRLEVTESLLAVDVFSAAEILRELKLMGIQISIDDFGTGYSSLSYLRRFPFDILKIDRSFISNMNADKESLAIVKTIIMLSKELGKSVVAEGIESQEHVEILSSLSCDFGQGFFFSKPVDFSAASILLNNQWQKNNKSSETTPCKAFAIDNFEVPVNSI